MIDIQLNHLVSALLTSPQMQQLWQIRDRGMPVFAHTIDVTFLCLDAIEIDAIETEEIEEYVVRRKLIPELDIAAIVVGSLLHDLSKLTARQAIGISHAHIMARQPTLAASAAVDLLDWAQRQTGIWLDPAFVDHVQHIVVSHHGPWGQVKPATAEAVLVHECDLYSATHHRLAPVDANDILPLLGGGDRLAVIGKKLGVGREVIKSRLREACVAEGVRQWSDLLPIWEQRRRVAIGPPPRTRQIERVRLVITLAQNVPASITSRLSALLAHDHLADRVANGIPAPYLQLAANRYGGPMQTGAQVGATV
ncbi:MAG: HD domain-containing protein [Chloroflexi bacterium]|nr:HD domain-containing protein [Chloroflexota bacterium]